MNWGAGANPRGVDRGIIRRMRTGWLPSKPNTILRSAGNANPNPILSFYEKRIVVGMMRNIPANPPHLAPRLAWKRSPSVVQPDVSRFSA
jgi:hypothetical protein